MSTFNSLNSKIASLASDKEDEEDSQQKLNKIFSIMATLEQRDLVYIFTTLFENLHGQVAALFTCYTLLTISLQCDLFKLFGKVFSETLKKQTVMEDLKLDTTTDTLEKLSNIKKEEFYLHLDVRVRVFLEELVREKKTKESYDDDDDIIH